MDFDLPGDARLSLRLWTTFLTCQAQPKEDGGTTQNVLLVDWELYNTLFAFSLGMGTLGTRYPNELTKKRRLSHLVDLGFVQKSFSPPA